MQTQIHTGMKKNTHQRIAVDGEDDIINVERRKSAPIIEFNTRSQELTVIARRKVVLLLFLKNCIIVRILQSSGALLDSKLEDAFSLELSNIHCLTVDALQKRFSADITYGLTQEEAAKRLAKYGPNEMTKPYEHPVWLKFILSFFSGFAPLLWIACFFVFLSWEPFGTPPSNIYNLALAIVLLIVIFISGLFNFYQEVQTSQVMQSFTSMVPQKATVIRRGETGEIDPVELVVGDLVKLTSGMRVPSDIRIISSNLTFSSPVREAFGEYSLKIFGHGIFFLLIISSILFHGVV